MARRQSKFKQSVRLFSFLDVLGGTVGILCLFIVVLLLEAGYRSPVVQIEAEETNVPELKVTTVICTKDQKLILNHNGETILTSLDAPILHHVLDSMQSNPRRVLVVGVRPGSFKVFRRLRDQAERRKILIGYEPLEQGWQIKSADGALL